MKKTINKKQLYKFLKPRACPEGLKRLRDYMRTRTARETIEAYRECKFKWSESSYIRGCDFNWLCGTLGMTYYHPLPTTDTIISKILDLSKTK